MLPYPVRMMARASGRRRLSAEIVEAVAVLEPHVDHGEGGGGGLELGQAFGDQLGRGHGEAAAFHGARDPLPE